MKTLIKILPALLILVACGGSGDEAIKKQILAKKQQIIKIEQQIAGLEKQLADTTEKVNAVPVAVKEMQGEPFNHYFLVYGNVEAVNYGMISPEMSGRIASIHVKEGDEVKKGTLLMTLNTEAIQQQIKGTETSLEMAETTFKKQKALWDQSVGSEIQYLQAKSNFEALSAQLETLKSQLRMAQVRAPFNGTVNKIYPKIGEMASPGMPTIEFVNLGSMRVTANVSEKFIGSVNKGQKVELKFSSLPDYVAYPTITRVSKVINSKSRTFEIELKVQNAKEKIKPNMVSTIKINDYSTPSAFVVPSLAIRKDFTGNYVYVLANGEGLTTVRKQYVTTSMSYQDNTMVTEGLKLGDKVIVEGHNIVSSGMPVVLR